MVAAGESPRLSDAPDNPEPARQSISNEPFNQRPGGRHVLRENVGIARSIRNDPITNET